MGKISILDCTLRDGGYVNDFLFGNTVIKSIIKGLSQASIDIIECGFLKSKEMNSDKSVFGSMEQLSQVITHKRPELMYVAMIQLGAIAPEELEDYKEKYADGIRLTFHEHEIDQAFEVGEKLMKKGYKVFMQPVGTTTYQDEVLLKLIKKVNDLKPFAFYIVDTLGTMYKNDLLRLFYLVDHNLNDCIALGFHSHNNLQMSFANAQELAQISCARDIIIDASIMGMGRGAGNLNTELLAQYLNVSHKSDYSNLEIMNIIDNYIRPLNAIYKWGYDVAYYLAAVKNCHPNYASYLLNLQTLTVRDIEAVLDGIDIDKRSLYDESLIQKEYLDYMDHHIDDQNALIEIKQLIGDKEVVLMAPGKSLNDYTEDTSNKYVISVNFFPQDRNIDMLFISNLKRFMNLSEMDIKKNIAVVITSNIMEKRKEDFYVINYYNYLNENEVIKDNAGLMCINMLKAIGIQNVRLVGFDGFSLNIQDNYYEDRLYIEVNSERLLKMNKAMMERLNYLRKKMNIRFATPTVYESEVI